MTWLSTARGLLPVRRTVRIGVTGLARSGKTALLTSLAANLLAAGAGAPTLPRLTTRLGGRSLQVSVSPADPALARGDDAAPLPRFNVPGHLAALAADPPSWPDRTSSVSLLALDIDIGQPRLFAAMPPQRLRLEVLDYPGEWLLDLPLLGRDFRSWSGEVLDRLESQPQAHAFLAFLRSLPDTPPPEEQIVRQGHRLYRDLLNRLRADGLSMLQPGRFLMPSPGPEPSWMAFFPWSSPGALGDLLQFRYDAYREAMRRELVTPSFGRVDRLVVLADLLSALHAGPAAFADAAAALDAVARALQRGGSLPDWLTHLLGFGIGRVAFAATKSDHVAERQRGNLAALAASLTRAPLTRGADHPGGRVGAFAIASVRCTEDLVWALDGHPVSAVRGRVAGAARAGRSYPGVVPDRPPGPGFWEHPFLALPDFEPMRLPLAGRGGVPHLNLDALLNFLLDDLL
ncbi:YcjX family protein [Rhodovastum atsumiense]|uniref:YcjX family protein n=1 Tax=Rhodovastum atsumiense TaxID=504468 RepID=A0A5M6J257_9PROT|nr:YcjX family protein [Rhodovastum atsumiense]KAA5614167.1 YcjX family protein [Rhodovastum atsumiense]